MRSYIRLLLIFFIAFFVFSNSFSQSLPNDLSKIKVENLSDDQILQMMKQAKDKGLSEQDLEAAALSRGMPRSEVMKLQQRIRLLQVLDGKSTSKSTEGVRENVDDIDFFSAISKVEKDPQLFKVYGSSLFNNEKLTFEPSLNIPTPPNYKLGAGDEVIIDIWGASQENFRLKVSPEGNIKINNLAPIYVNGLTVDDASKRIIGKLSEIYSGLKSTEGRKANTFAMVTLGNVRSIKVNIVGEVVLPGTYTLPSLASVFNALYASGGPNLNGSFRSVQVLRNNKVISTLDVYDFLLKGDQSNNITLQEQDVIHVKPFDLRIEIKGEVKRPGLYEGKEGETIDNIIKFAGNFTDQAYTQRVTVKRTNGREREVLDASMENFNKVSLVNGDVIEIGKVIERFQNRVQVQGAVYKEGIYQLKDSLTVSKLLERAEGVRGDASLARATIYRTKPDFSIEIISFDLGAVLRGEEDYLLRREDNVRIFSIYELKDEFYVEIFGEINRKGTYPFFRNMTLEDLISMAGGLHEAASISKIEISRRKKNFSETTDGQIAEVFNFDISKDLSFTKDGAKFILQPFDKVVVRRSPNYEIQKIVQVEGEVIYPGRYSIITKNDRISDVVKRAGGLSPEAYPKGATLIRYTELHVPESEYQIQLKRLQELKNAGYFKEKERRKRVGTEGEDFILERLQNIDMILDNDAGFALSATNLKRQRLSDINKRDTLVELNIENYREAIGIDLNKILENPGSKYDILLQDGDIISIPKELQTVRVRGELLYPITVRHDKSSLKYYILQAGGFNSNANRRKTYVIYPNGSVASTRSFLGIKTFPRIEPGSEVIVPKKAEKRKLNPQEAIGIGSGLASLSLIIITLLNRF
jgi:protein involved in polysaccharide export with SLBB domain